MSQPKSVPALPELR